MTDLLEQLRDADPVDRAGLEVPAALAARVADCRRRPPRTWRRPAIAGGGLAAACVVLAVVLSAGGGHGRLSLADKAYAATTGPGVRHWKVSIRTFIDGRRRGIVQRQEGWAQGPVLHVLLLDGHRLTSDIRQSGRRARSWNAATNDYVETTVPRHRPRGPLQLGDPFADFRRAHDAHRLVRVNATTYRLRPDKRSMAPGDTLTYELDPRTALPTKAVLAYTRGAGPSPSALDGARYRIVFTYDLYERLADTATTRAKLRLLPHAGAGPSQTDARSVFSILRDGTRPTAAQQRIADGLADAFGRHARLDASSARVGPHGVVLIAGKGYVAMMRGGGGTLATVDTAVKRGMAIGGSAVNKDHSMYLVVPDGVTAVRARRPHQPWRTFAVDHNVVVLPGGGHHFRLVR